MIDPISNKGKPVFFFGSYGWSGEGCKNLTARADGIGLKPFAEAKRVVFKPTDADLDEIRETGKQFAQALK